MDHHGWNVIDADAAVLWREYRFSGQGVATTMTFRGTDGGLVVVSPGIGLSAADYDALKEFGEVRALIANNTFHHMGQRAWREHFKDAQSYAPPRAVEALKKKVQGVPFRPLGELALPGNVHWDDPPGYKTGEAILSVDTKRGSVWYAGDLLANIPRLPPPPVRWLFTLTDSGPGYRLFRLAVWLLLKDKKATKEWALARLAKDPPGIVVPAHGPPVEVADVVAQTRAQLERM